MEERIAKLEQALQNLLAKINKEDHVNWLTLPSTRALQLQMRIDGEELRENWALAQYSGPMLDRAQGQAAYIDSMLVTMREFYQDD